MNSLDVLILHIMLERRETLKLAEGHWLDEAINFVEATSWASPYEVSDVSLAVSNLG